MIEPIPTRAHFSRLLAACGIITTLAGFRFENGPLFAIGIFLLGLMTAVWLLWRLTFFRLSGKAEIEEIRGFLGEELNLSLSITNQKVIPLFWLNAFYSLPQELGLGKPAEDGSEAIELARNPAAGRLTLRSFWSIGGYQTRRRQFVINCKKRGYYRLGPLRIESGDPLGFYAGRMRLEERLDLIIYPHIYSLTEMRLPANLPFGEARAQRRLFEDPLRTIGIREWEMGDQMRRIHWKATAKAQALHSRVYEPATEEQILIFLNVATLEKHWQGYLPELQERTISVAAGLAYQIAEQRLPVGLIANGYMPGQGLYLRLLPGRAPGQLTHILELLARVTPMAIGPLESLMLWEMPRIPMGTTIVVVTAVTYPALLAVIEEIQAAGRSVILMTLAKEPPDRPILDIELYHLGHFSEDLGDVVETVKLQ